MLMALLFVGGLMNLAWVGAIMVLVLVEKIIPWGDWMSRLTGVIFILWGASSLARII
jgi:predicted metal-binding membrane protein